MRGVGEEGISCAADKVYVGGITYYQKHTPGICGYEFRDKIGDGIDPCSLCKVADKGG